MPNYATLIKDGQRVSVKDKAEADKLMSQGFTLEKEAPPQPPPQPPGAPPGQAGQKSYMDFITEAFKSPEYEQAQTQYDEALAKLTELQAEVPGYLDRESQRLEEADPVLQKMMEQRATQTGALYSKPMEAREKYKDIFDPTKREALVAGAIGNVMGQLSGTGGLIEQQRGFAGQRAQTALDALLAQAGMAETAVGAATEQRDFLKDLLTTGAAEEYAEQYKPVSEEEWADIEKQLGLQKAYSVSSSEGDLTPWQQYQIMQDEREEQRDLKTEFYKVMNSYRPLMEGYGKEGATMTREQLGDVVKSQFQEFDPDSIMEEIYTAYPDIGEGKWWNPFD